MLIPRLQAQLRYGAAQAMQAISVPPFTLFYNADSDSLYSNYAIPDAFGEGDLTEAIATLKATFYAHQRTPRLEYLEDFAPTLAAALEANGFRQEIRTLLMVCTPCSFRAAPVVPGLNIHPVNGDSPIADQRAAVTVQDRSFGSEDAPEASEEKARLFFKRFASQQLFLAKVDEQAVSVASLMPAYDGIAEIAGVATLSAFRRCGIGAAITGHAVQVAFGQGVEVAFLTAMDERAGRVYTRVGFDALGAGLAFVEE
ncbi:MAG: GNAT family N-acetyltransferase [Anaerolineales bacterium]|nr:GNAT family N-acetyltransferase [Anaerolineales bacterium]